jgi:phosphotriesterase-related protein
MKMPSLYLQTVTGPETVEKLGVILPHEHLFTDLRGPHTPGYAQGDPQAVFKIVGPHLAQAENAGVTVLVECSTGGVGRNIHILRHLAARTRIKIIAPTGVYREAYIPAELRETPLKALAQMWIKDLTEGIAGTDSRAGFIKLAVSDDGITDREKRNLEAAVIASHATGAAIASHTIGGERAMQEMELLAAAGLELDRFIWVHANAEPDPAYHLEAGRRGAYVELDGLGSSPAADEDHLRCTRNLVEAGYAEQVLLSHDAGWYQPGSPTEQPENGYRGYTALIKEFIPRLQSVGISDDVIRLLVHTNPARAFGFKPG